MHTGECSAEEPYFGIGLNKPSGPVKPARSGSGLPDRFDRKLVKTGQIQNHMFNRFDRFTGRFDW